MLKTGNQINHIVDTFNWASMLGSGINDNAEEAEGSNLACEFESTFGMVSPSIISLIDVMVAQRNNTCPFYEILAPVLVNQPPMAEHNSSPTLHRSLDPPNPERAASRVRVQRQNENLEDEPFNDDDDADEDDQGAMNVDIRDGPRRQDGHVSDDADLEMDDVNEVNDRRNELARQKKRNDERRHKEKLAMLRRQHVNLMKYKRGEIRIRP